MRTPKWPTFRPPTIFITNQRAIARCQPSRHSSVSLSPTGIIYGCHIFSRCYSSPTLPQPHSPIRYIRQPSPSPTPGTIRACIAFGSNLGDRLKTINQACRALADHPEITISRTSALYETAPWGHVADQPNFLNGACDTHTTLEPLSLLDVLQEIENNHNRTREIRWGPRTLDLDILLYGDQRIATDRLTVPHPRMTEREFVLRPLQEYVAAPLNDLNHLQTLTILDSLDNAITFSTSGKRIDQHIRALPEQDASMATSFSLTPANSIRASRPTRPCQIMSILNVTPDSFSDGGRCHELSAESLEATIQSHIDNGASMIDIGGQSSRPGAAVVSEQVEIDRIMPAIEAAIRVRSRLDRQDIAVSIDTYRASVARAALRAGADMINDISAGRLDPGMLATVADFNKPIVLMHMRGDPANMSEPPHTVYTGDLMHTIARELLERVEAAEAAGIRRWQIMLDPGIGFAKTQAQNLEILRRFSELRAAPGLQNLPWMVGASRKKFLGAITGVKTAADRDWPTAATVAAAVQGGADVVRVHAVREMAMVKDVSQAIWRV